VNRFLKNFYYHGARVLTHILYRTKFVGLENIPKEGPAILISNHVSYVDGLILHTAIKRPIRYVIDEGIYSVPAVNYFLREIGAIPIAPNKDSVKRALEAVEDAMRNGEVVHIFPEGSLTYTGNMRRFRFGVEWMSKQNNVPVIPMALGGLWGSIFSRKYLRSKFRFLPRSIWRKVTLVVGEPINSDKVSVNYLQRIVMKLKNSIYER